MAFPDAWKEFFFVSVMPENGGPIEFHGFTEELGLPDSEKDVESITLGNGGRILKHSPMSDSELTMKCYPVKADLTTDAVIQLFNPQTTTDSTQPILVRNTLTRKKHRLVVLWSNAPDLSAYSAGTIPATGVEAKRFQVVNAYMTKCNYKYDDKLMSAEVTFKWSPFNKSATENARWESTDGTAQLPAIASSAVTW